MPNDIAVLIHTCDKYNFLWDGWCYYFRKHWDKRIVAPVYFANEELDITWHDIIHLPTGKGEWSDRLTVALNELSETCIFYMQDDHWPCQPMNQEIFYGVYKSFKSRNADLIHIAPDCKYYSTRYEYGLLRFEQNSMYLISHQAGFWNKSFLLNALLPNETPWKNETQGTKRLIKSGIDHKIYLSPYSWYENVCHYGQLTDKGREMRDNIE